MRAYNYAEMAALEELEETVRDKVVKEGWTYSRLSKHLQQLYPGIRGFSVRSLERFCGAHCIHRTSRLKAQQVDTIVAGAIAKVKILQGR